MLDHTTSLRALRACLCLVVLAGCAAQIEGDDGETVAGVSEALSNCAPTIPEAIAVPEGNKLAFVLGAEGAQIYACQAAAAGGFAWVFQAPEADLLKRNGRIAGSHYVGPTWEALDGSTVVGARVSGVTVDPTAIPWLLLRATAHTGEGRMAKVTFIHRLETAGGLAPATGCDEAHAGAVADVPYTATYAFYEAKKAGP